MMYALCHPKGVVADGAANSSERALLDQLYCLLERKQVLEQIQPSQVASILTWMDSVGDVQRQGRLVRTLTWRVVGDIAVVQSLGIQDAVRIIEALTTVSATLGSADYQEHWSTIFKHLRGRCHLLRPVHIYKLMYAFAKVKERNPAILAALMKEAMTRQSEFFTLPTLALARSSVAMTQLECVRPALIEAAAAHCAEQEETDGECVQMFLWTMAKAKMQGSKAIDLLVQKACQPHVVFSARASCFTLWSLCKLQTHPLNLIPKLCAAALQDERPFASLAAPSTQVVLLGLPKVHAVAPFLSLLAEHAVGVGCVDTMQPHDISTLAKELTSLGCTCPAFYHRIRLIHMQSNKSRN
eukprot:Sspe_Gene.22334::Locus_8477_Transcript_1_1_Confidence_1.000_Length_1149::g.22334::m.22334